MSDGHEVQLLCITLGVARSGFYAWRERRRRPARDAALQAQIAQLHAQSRGTYGSPRIHWVLRQQGLRVSRKRIARCMRAAQLMGRTRRRYRVQTTDSRHDQPIAPNLLQAQPVPQQPNQVWVSDITYLKTDEGALYLAAVMDLASRRILGWALDTTLHTSLPAAALRMALQGRSGHGVIHHSDRGCQYASTAYVRTLRRHGLRSSMSRRANCYDNAHMESFWSTLKLELVYRTRFATRAAARSAIFRYIEGFYNRSRCHSALGYQSPLDYENSFSPSST